MPDQTMNIMPDPIVSEDQTESLLSALKNIAMMPVNETTDHAQLLSVCVAIAITELQRFCCGNAACCNEGTGLDCDALNVTAT